MTSRLIRTVLAAFAFQCVFLLLIIALRLCVETRYIPSIAMQPTLQVNDRFFVEKLSKYRGDLVERGAIVCFYPPPIEMPGGKDPSFDIPHIMGRLTGLPLFPNDPVFVKRIIGLPGDRIQIKSGTGVFVNNKLLSEPYVSAPPSYDLDKLSDIYGRSMDNQPLKPYGNNNQPIVVPKGQLFVLGDNRDNSEDSHVWGFLPQERITGRAWVMVYPFIQPMHSSDWIRPVTNQATKLQLQPHTAN
ncbi:MAG: signal peptidase I [Candidatus Obscuribacter sp.]|nr:signal peptidase I [Candidatus Obscuribacter sp.]MBK9771384.1 signal peptidase I [Candidatus Obscuribacter sp.]